MTTARQNGHTAHTPAAPGFGQALRTYRLRAGLSQKRLAHFARLECSYVSRLESGTRHPSHPVVGWLADALDLTPVDRAELEVAAGFWPAVLAATSAREVVDLVQAKEGL